MSRLPVREIDRVVFGAGIFGLYAAIILGRRGLRVAIVDLEARPLSRASLVNQARIHMGYHTRYLRCTV